MVKVTYLHPVSVGSTPAGTTRISDSDWKCVEPKLLPCNSKTQPMLAGTSKPLNNGVNDVIFRHLAYVLANLQWFKFKLHLG